jgi:AcrR family transcriptional regulator
VSSTKQRIVETSAELFRRQGYSATGVKQIVSAAQAPFGSLYHFFPGGKEELGAEAIRVSAGFYLQLIPAVFDPAPDLISGIRDFFAGAAAHLEQTDYVDACPIATVALEVSSTSEPMRAACEQAFESWILAGAARFERAGLHAESARELAIATFCALEGAFVLARAGRTTEPLRIAGELIRARAQEAIDQQRGAHARPSRSAHAPTEAGSHATPPNATSAAPVRPRLRARWPDREAPRSPGPASP